MLDYPFNVSKWAINEGKSAESLYHQVAACAPDMFWNFYLIKNYKIANNSKNVKSRK
jgi:hypothetical protein